MGDTNEPTTTPRSSEPVHVQIVLDRSGSMTKIASATVDELNGFLAKQPANLGVLRLSLADFETGSGAPAAPAVAPYSDARIPNTARASGPQITFVAACAT